MADREHDGRVTITAKHEGPAQADTMVFLAGQEQSFHCSCGCNVFKRVKPHELRYRCNSCRAVYEGTARHG
jgi:hypothetical protein